VNDPASVREELAFLREWERRFPGAWDDFRERLSRVLMHDGPKETYPPHLMSPRFKVAALRVWAELIESGSNLRRRRGRPAGSPNKARMPGNHREADRRRRQREAKAERDLAELRAALRAEFAPPRAK
jgi:hypothetical protein